MAVRRKLRWYKPELGKTVQGLDRKVRDSFAEWLQSAVEGENPPPGKVKIWSGCGSGVWQLKKDQWRLVYTTFTRHEVCVVHVFQKDASRDKRTRPRDRNLVERRVKVLRKELGSR